MEYYLVNYKGKFGFIKPWTAVRDSETFSQQFLTPSIVAGIERKLFPDLLQVPFGHYKILRHRLSYEQVSSQTEQIQPRGWNSKKKGAVRPYTILTRSVLLNPSLWLAFERKEDAVIAAQQHICLCRNEDILFPMEVLSVSEEVFDTDVERFSGYELLFEENEQSFLVGYNRMDENKPMYGWLKTIGHPVKTF